MMLSRFGKKKFYSNKDLHYRQLFSFRRIIRINSFRVLDEDERRRREREREEKVTRRNSIKTKSRISIRGMNKIGKCHTSVSEL